MYDTTLEFALEGTEGHHSCVVTRVLSLVCATCLVWRKGEVGGGQETFPSGHGWVGAPLPCNSFTTADGQHSK